MNILGISGYYHDSAAALVCDGEIIAAAQEERFSRIKHDSSFPKHAVQYCLESAGLSVKDIDAVVFYEKPLLKFDRLFKTHLAFAPKSLKAFVKAMPIWIKEKLHLPQKVKMELGGSYKNEVYFSRHHESHAASAFYPSNFEQAAVLTIDGVGEWATVSWGVGEKNKLMLKKEMRFPHSIGLLYSAFTYYLGFKVNSGEYKVMGLAPYGEPKFIDKILSIIDLKEDGSFRMDMGYFNYCEGLTMTSSKFHDLFDGPPRENESEISQKEMDIAASIQRVIEIIIMKMCNHIHCETGLDNLCLAGGGALNCVSNGRLLRDGPFKNIWIQPAAGDAGGALGAALYYWFHLLDNPREITLGQFDAQKGSYLGPEITFDDAKEYLESIGAKYSAFPDDKSTFNESVAELLAQGQVIGRAAGPMEFGPRALGNRSILGDPRNSKMQSILNLKIKYRESFRPFAPSCLSEKKDFYFDLDSESPYMLLVAQVNESLCSQMSSEEQKLFGIDKLNIVRSEISAVTHVDYSARIQTVSEETNKEYYELIRAFERCTGCGVVVNTSFNIRGEPIVCTAEDAYRCFMFTDMDVLIFDGIICLKPDQPPMSGVDEYKEQFKLD